MHLTHTDTRTHACAACAHAHTHALMHGQQKRCTSHSHYLAKFTYARTPHAWQHTPHARTRMHAHARTHAHMYAHMYTHMYTHMYAHVTGPNTA